MITILGPTATGKTKLAALTAHALNGEIISADSRQVFRGMDLGTGKDYNDYVVEGRLIESHLIDVEDPGKEFSVHRFVKEFNRAYDDIKSRNKIPVLCGGTGLYLEAVLKGYNLPAVPVNEELRKILYQKSLNELSEILKSVRETHNTTDFTDKERAVRAVEIAEYMQKHQNVKGNEGKPSLVFGITGDRILIRQKITDRLKQRLNAGLIDEVKYLHENGISYEMLYYYGLEYRYISMYLNNKMGYEEMFTKLNTAIHQFAKRQMTWFRRMEKNGIKINWLQLEDADDKKLSVITELFERNFFSSME